MECGNFDPLKRPTAVKVVEMLTEKKALPCYDIPLAVSQSTAVENHDDLVAVGAATLQVIAEDATNSCAFLLVLICNHVIEQELRETMICQTCKLL